MKFFAVAVYVEVVAHMSAAVIFTGWNSGFQISIIGIIILVFFSEYIGRTLKLPYNRSVRLSLLGVFAYVASFIYLKIHPAPYSLPSEIEFRLQIAWGVIVFSIVIAFLHIFVELAFRGEEFIMVGKAVNNSMSEQYILLDGLRSTVRECDFTYNGHTIHATITMGVAGYEQGMSIEKWIGIADKKLYVGKYSGKNKLVS